MTQLILNLDQLRNLMGDACAVGLAWPDGAAKPPLLGGANSTTIGDIQGTVRSTWRLEARPVFSRA